MSMQAASLEVLEKAKVPSPQARAIVQAIEIEIEAAHNTLATKQDITLLRQDTKHDITLLRQDTKQDMTLLRQNTKQDIAEARHALDLKIGEVDKKVDVKFGELDKKVDVKFGELDNKVDVKFAVLETKISECTKDVSWKVIGTFVALFSVLLGAMYFFVSHVTLESVRPQPAALSNDHSTQPVSPAAVPAPRAPPKPPARLTPLFPFPAPTEPAGSAVP